MRIFTEDEVVFKDFDDLEKVLREINLPDLSNSIKLIYDMSIGREAKAVFKSYIRDRKSLTKLLRKNYWNEADRVEAFETKIKICSKRDYLDMLLEEKEEEIKHLITSMLSHYPQTLEFVSGYLEDVQKKIESNPSYIRRMARGLRSRIVSRKKIRRKKVEVREDKNPVVLLELVLSQPRGRYDSHVNGLTKAENRDADTILLDINKCRKILFKYLKRLSPEDFYKTMTGAYKKENELLKYINLQEKFETGKIKKFMRGQISDRRLIDSAIKNLCPDIPPHYEGATSPKEFMYKLLQCPTVQGLLPKLSNKVPEEYQKNVATPKVI